MLTPQQRKGRLRSWTRKGPADWFTPYQRNDSTNHNGVEKYDQLCSYCEVMMKYPVNGLAQHDGIVIIHECEPQHIIRISQAGCEYQVVSCDWLERFEVGCHNPGHGSS